MIRQCGKSTKWCRYKLACLHARTHARTHTHMLFTSNAKKHRRIKFPGKNMLEWSKVWSRNLVILMMGFPSPPPCPWKPKERPNMNCRFGYVEVNSRWKPAAAEASTPHIAKRSCSWWSARKYDLIISGILECWWTASEITALAMSIVTCWYVISWPFISQVLCGGKAGRSQAPHLAMFPGEQDPKIYITRYDRYLALSWLNVRLRLYLHLFARFCKVLRRLQRTSAMRCDEVLLWGFRCSPSVVEAVGEVVSASSKSLRACVWKNDGYMMVIYSVKYCVI